MIISKSLRAFNHRNYRILFPSLALSNIGTWAQRIAQDWLVLELTHSSVDLGLVTGLQFVPTLLLSAYGGVLADRLDKRILLGITNAGAGLVSLVLGMLIVTNSVNIQEVYLFAALLGLFNAIDGPVRASFTSELVGKSDMANAISLNSANFNIGRLIGPALSGIMISAFGTGPSFLLNSLTYVCVLISLALMTKRDLHLGPAPTSKAKFSEAFAYISKRPDLQIVMLTVLATATFGMNYQIFNALMATLEFHKGPAEFGSLGTFLAVGSLAGALLSSRFESSRVPRKIMLGAFTFGILLVFLANMPTYLSYSLALPFGGSIALLTLISANSYVQTTTDAHIRGRVMGIYLTIFMGGTPFFSPVIGWLSNQFGIRVTIAICGTLVALSAGVLLTVYSSGRKRQIAETGDTPTMAIDII